MHDAGIQCLFSSPPPFPENVKARIQNKKKTSLKQNFNFTSFTDCVTESLFFPVALDGVWFSLLMVAHGTVSYDSSLSLAFFMLREQGKENIEEGKNIHPEHIKYMLVGRDKCPISALYDFFYVCLASAFQCWFRANMTLVDDDMFYSPPGCMSMNHV